MSDEPDQGARRGRRVVRKLAFLAAAIGLTIGAYVSGLIWFAESIPRTLDNPNEATDAIVVLTGGQLRLKEGLVLLNEGRAKKLFVTGVSHSVDLPELLRTAHQPAQSVQCCVVLGHEADNTAGNAIETRDWMAKERFKSLRLVTANYHVQRSLLEFHRAMPGVKIIVHPVFPEPFKRDEWWHWPGTLALIINEYNKFLGAYVRAVIVPQSPAPP
jgi:uncharacterized SAM-binding protein YcdF (DUF218 family)